MKQLVLHTRRRGQILPLFAVFLGFLLGLSALAFDIAYAMVVQTQLVAALDAATLSAIRYVPQGDAQMAAAAQRNFAANLPAGKLLISNPTLSNPSKTIDAGTVRVAFDASADIPMFFARWFRTDGMTIRAHSEAARRDRNVILVLDYSGSVAPVLEEIKNAAKAFVNSFSEQFDQVGLVVFSTSGRIMYPPQYNFKAGLNAAIDGIDDEMYTNHAAGLYWSYRALKELVDPLKDQKSNEIVFFTDGNANWFPGTFEVRNLLGFCSADETNGVLGIKSGGLLSIYNNKILNMEAQPPPLAPLLTPLCSLLNLLNNPLIRIKPQWIPDASPTAGPIFPGGVNMAGFKNNFPNLNQSDPSNNLRRDIAKNVTDNLARLIRKDPLGIRIHAIGYEGTSGLEYDVLERMSNCEGCAAVDPMDAADPTQAKGRFVLARSSTQLLQAFLDVAGFIGRIVN